MEDGDGTSLFCPHQRLFVSLSAFNTGFNLGWLVLVLSFLGLSVSLWLEPPLSRLDFDAAGELIYAVVQ